MTNPAIRAVVLGIAVGALLLMGCARNPVSGRPELVLTSEAGEIKQGQEAAKAVAQLMGLVENPQLLAYVDTIGQRLARQSPREELEHHFYVVEMAVPNAFALPGGHIYVSRGLLAMVNSEDELANAIGHEIGHVAARHSVRQQVRSTPFIPVKIAAGLGGLAAGIVSPTLGRVVSGVGQLPGSLVLASYSRDQEREADRLGQQFAAAVGWDPAAMGRFMHTLSRDEALQGDDPSRSSFFASHPSSPERAADSRGFAATLDRAKPDPAALSHTEFLRELEGIVVGERAAEGVFVGNRFLQPELDFALTFPKDWETTNGRDHVAARSPDKKGFLVLQIVGEGEDPLEAARAFAKKHSLRDEPQALRIAGLAAAQAVSESSRSTLVHLTWVAHGGRVYQLAGISPAESFAAQVSLFDAAGRSFRPLKQAERAEIRESRLRVTGARAGETLEQLVERTGSSWTPEETAVANGIKVGVALPDGKPIKLAMPEPYRSATR
jgi:predicted Zn-dependent protease